MITTTVERAGIFGTRARDEAEVAFTECIESNKVMKRLCNAISLSIHNWLHVVLMHRENCYPVRRPQLASSFG